ncbi:MAG: glycosyltransferase family 9 protein, partial [Thermomicrobiales bacterium]
RLPASPGVWRGAPPSIGGPGGLTAAILRSRYVPAPAPPAPAAPQRILVVKLFTLGDMLNITPALRALRARYPAARIDVLATRVGAAGLARSPHIDDVIIFDKALFDQVGGLASPRALLAGLRFALTLRRRRYDVLVLLHHLITTWGTLKYMVLALWSGAPVRAGLDNGRGWFLAHRARDRGFGAVNERRYWLDVVATLGAVSDDERPDFTVTDADRAAAQKLLGPTSGPVIVIHPTNGPYAPKRQWAPERFAAVADRLAREHGATIVLAGVASEAERIAAVERAMATPAINLAGRTELPVLAGLLQHADLVIGNDSAVCHLAAALGTPTLAIFGPANDRAWAPYGAQPVVLPLNEQQQPCLPTSRVLTVRGADPHAPCLYTGYGPGNPHGCPNCRCLDLIDANRIAGLAAHLLARHALCAATAAN